MEMFLLTKSVGGAWHLQSPVGMVPVPEGRLDICEKERAIIYLACLFVSTIGSVTFLDVKSFGLTITRLFPDPAPMINFIGWLLNNVDEYVMNLL